MATSPRGSDGHHAQLYDDLPFLAAKVAAYFAGGLRQGGAVVAVARPEHLAAIGSVLADSELDATALTASGRLILLDAETTLAALSTDGALDRAKFHSLIGGVIAAIKARSTGPIRIYGEMVDVLWDTARADEMLALEALWNELLATERVELMCGYRLSGFSDSAHAHTFQRMCAAHATVVPVERDVEKLLAESLQREHDLARQYRLERAARLAAEEATHAREEILSVVSHDLRNPLGTIIMGASTLRDALDPADPKASRMVSIADRIHRQAQRMARQIEDLVDFAGIEAGKLAIARTPHEPSSLIAATSELFRPIASERGVAFEASAVAALPVVSCDAERVVQIFGNLVGNAIKVTPRGGSIAIGAEPAEDEVVFFVRDTGPGIAADELPSLFERHWRSKQAHYKGAGLGLSIARGLVEAHGGRIWAESQVGRGSTFFFSLTSTQN